MTNNNKLLILIAVALVLAAIVGFSAYNRENNDSVGDRIGRSVENATDNTVLEEFGEDVEDATDGNR
jgi:hypothetical protein